MMFYFSFCYCSKQGNDIEGVSYTRTLIVSYECSGFYQRGKKQKKKDNSMVQMNQIREGQRGNAPTI